MTILCDASEPWPQEAQTDGSSNWGLTAAGKALLPKAPSAKQTWQQQQQAVLDEFPALGLPGSAAGLTFARAMLRAGNDPSKALSVARATLGS